MVLERKIPRKIFGPVKRRGIEQGKTTSLRGSLETSHIDYGRESCRETAN